MPEDCGSSDSSDSEADSERLAVSSEAEESKSPGGSAELFMKLKEKPEELLQLAPEAGDAILPLMGGETGRPSHKTSLRSLPFVLL